MSHPFGYDLEDSGLIAAFFCKNSLQLPENSDPFSDLSRINQPDDDLPRTTRSSPGGQCLPRSCYHWRVRRELPVPSYENLALFVTLIV